MKAVLRSVKPYWLYLILTGKKTIEVGKSCPQAKDWNKVVEMYCSKDMRSFNRIPEEDKEWMHKYLGKVACRFVCEWISEYDCELYNDGSDEEIRSVWYDEDDGERYTEIIARTGNHPWLSRHACMSWDEFKAYMGEGEKTFYAWHISDLKIYDTPKELSEFQTPPCEKSEKSCGKCKYFVVINTPDMYETDCYVANGRQITRPPESWMYVRELEERK